MVVFWFSNFQFIVYINLLFLFYLILIFFLYFILFFIFYFFASGHLQLNGSSPSLFLLADFLFPPSSLSSLHLSSSPVPPLLSLPSGLRWWFLTKIGLPTSYPPRPDHPLSHPSSLWCRPLVSLPSGVKTPRTINCRQGGRYLTPRRCPWPRRVLPVLRLMVQDHMSSHPHIHIHSSSC